MIHGERALGDLVKGLALVLLGGDVGKDDLAGVRVVGEEFCRYGSICGFRIIIIITLRSQSVSMCNKNVIIELNFGLFDFFGIE